MAKYAEFSPDDMLELISYGHVPGFELIEDVITDTGRWSIHHRIVFKHDGKYYETSYSVGATECQYEVPFDGMKIVSATEVVPQKYTAIKYVPA